MKRVFHRFARSEDGNATIDWVVLMSGIVLLAIAVVGLISGDAIQLSDTISNRVESTSGFSPG